MEIFQKGWICPRGQVSDTVVENNHETARQIKNGRSYSVNKNCHQASGMKSRTHSNRACPRAAESVHEAGAPREREGKKYQKFKKKSENMEVGTKERRHYSGAFILVLANHGCRAAFRI